MLGQEEGRQRAGQGARDAHVQRIEMGAEVPAWRAQQHQGDQAGRARAGPAQRRKGDGCRAARAADRHPQPGLPVAHPEGVIRQHRHPQVKRRLLEILEPVVADRDPVAAAEHLARDLGIAAFVGAQQMAGIQTAEPDQRHGEQSPSQQAQRALAAA
jgi:hypothetical protein